MPAPTVPTRIAPPRHDMSVVLVTGSYDHEIRFWEAWSGICSRTITRTGESGVSIATHYLYYLLCLIGVTASQQIGDLSRVRSAEV